MKETREASVSLVKLSNSCPSECNKLKLVQGRCPLITVWESVRSAGATLPGGVGSYVGELLPAAACRECSGNCLKKWSEWRKQKLNAAPSNSLDGTHVIVGTACIMTGRDFLKRNWATLVTRPLFSGKY